MRFDKSQEVFAIDIELEAGPVERLFPVAAVPDESADHKEARDAGAWAAAEIEDMKKAKEISPGITITELSRKLERRMLDANKAGKPLRPIKARSMENGLREWGLWPITFIK